MSNFTTLVEVGDGFWNLRGSFMFEAMDIGTQMSFIRLINGRFLVVDTCDFPMFYKMYPNARYYGTPRHLRNVSAVQWSGSITDPEVYRLWESDEVFIRIPDCAEFINPAMSVFVFHKPSRTLHDDDTVNTHPDGTMDFHPQVFSNLFTSSDGPGKFHDFISRIIEEWDFDNLAAGHSCVKIGGAKDLLIATLKDSKPSLDALYQQFTS